MPKQSHISGQKPVLALQKTSFIRRCYYRNSFRPLDDCRRIEAHAAMIERERWRTDVLATVSTPGLSELLMNYTADFVDIGRVRIITEGRHRVSAAEIAATSCRLSPTHCRPSPPLPRHADYCHAVRNDMGAAKYLRARTRIDRADGLINHISRYYARKVEMTADFLIRLPRRAAR